MTILSLGIVYDAVAILVWILLPGSDITYTLVLCAYNFQGVQSVGLSKPGYLNQWENVFLSGVLANQVPGLIITMSKTDYTIVLPPGFIPVLLAKTS